MRSFLKNLWKRPKAPLVMLALITINTAACGPALKPKGFGQDPIPKTSQSSSLVSNADWRCPEPGTFNITPSSGRLGGEGSYTACRSASDPSKMKISGLTRSSLVCIYPMNYRNGTTSVELVDRRRCYQLGTGPLIIQFDSSQVSYLYIVDSQLTNAMEACLSGTSDCPSYSSGSLY